MVARNENLKWIFKSGISNRFLFSFVAEQISDRTDNLKAARPGVKISSQAGPQFNH